MIRCVTIREHGPQGLCWAILEAPGSMCVLTVPGLPTAPLEAPKPFRKRFVLTGNYGEFLLYIESRDLEEGEQAVYVRDLDWLEEWENPLIVFTGSWVLRQDFREFEREHRYGRSGKPLTIEYHDISPR